MGFAFNLVYKTNMYLSNSITKIELHQDGKKATLTFGRARAGGSKVVDIKDIKKLQNEKSLVETFEEPYLFPIAVGNKTYYVNGQG